MKAIDAIAKMRGAVPDAQVLVLVDGRYIRVDDIVLTGVDPTIALTSVCIKGEEFIPRPKSAQEVYALLKAYTISESEPEPGCGI